MDLNGFPVTLMDTAGLRDTDDKVEKIGIERALQRAELADLRLYLTLPGEKLDTKAFDRDIVRLAKGDTLPSMEGAVSGKTGQGINDLVSEITDRLSEQVGVQGVATRHRHRSAMQQSLTCLVEAKTVLSLGPEQYVIAAEELRFATRSLDSIVGRVDVENLLDEIFSSFCIGK